MEDGAYGNLTGCSGFCLPFTIPNMINNTCILGDGEWAIQKNKFDMLTVGISHPFIPTKKAYLPF